MNANLKKKLYESLRSDAVFDLATAGATAEGLQGGMGMEIKMAEYGKSLPQLRQELNNVMGMIFNTIGDHSTETESVGQVQQNDKERSQEESSKILSIMTKKTEREKAIANLFARIGHINPSFPTDPDKITITINPVNLPTEEELEEEVMNTMETAGEDNGEL